MPSFDPPPTVYLENGKTDENDENVAKYLSTIGVEIRHVSTKKIERGHEDIDKGGVPIGRIPLVHAVLKAQGFEIPFPNDYPEILRPFLKRQVWKGRLINAEKFAPVFAKPRTKVKRFTGQVVHDYRDVYWVSKHTEVWFSDVVDFVNEYRVYVVNGEILGGFDHLERAEVAIDEETVSQVVALLGDITVAVDFGRLSNGETALVEVNVPYSIGNYGLTPAEYARFAIEGYRQTTIPTYGVDKRFI